MSLCIISKKIGDSNVTLLKDGLINNLLCEQTTHGYLSDKRIFWFFSGCPCECFMILCIIEDLGWNKDLWVFKLLVHDNI